MTDGDPGPGLQLERVVVSRKTPQDGRLMISAATADRLARLGAEIELVSGPERGQAHLSTMSCTCGRGDSGSHLHHFVESPLLTRLVPGGEVRLELDERAFVLSVEQVGPSGKEPSDLIPRRV